MTDPVITDIVVTVLGATGCGLYFHFLWQREEVRGSIRASLFLFGTLTLLLALRGPFWYYGSPALGHLVFASATLLPLAISLFCEQLLRRHHPLWLKILAATTTIFFFLTNFGGDLYRTTVLLASFMICLMIVLAANAFFLLRATRSDHSVSELRIARAVVVAALISLPLIVSDFREDLDIFPFRLGALGALLLVCVLLNASGSSNAIWRLLGRLLVAVATACVLSLAFALTMVGIGENFLRTAVSGVPIALAWMLLTTVVVRVSELFAQNSDNFFLWWLLHARMDTAASFLKSLKYFPETSEYLVLEKNGLEGYSLDELFALNRKEPIDIAEVRSWQRDGIEVDAAEQLIDMLERNGMTHALLISKDPPLVALVRFPQGIHAHVGRLRTAVIQRIARKLPPDETAR